MAWLDGPKTVYSVREEGEIWAVCPKCKSYFEKEKFPRGIGECPACGAPKRLGAKERIASILDEGTFAEIGTDIPMRDPLGFSDASGSYAGKLVQTRAKTGIDESVVAGTGKIGGREIALAVMDFRFMGGSLGSGAGERIVLLAELALERKLPLVVFTASGGARMHEGIISLMQMARTNAAIAALQEARIPYISVLTDPTTGGVSASYALTADIVVAEPRALVGFAGRRVIENTIKEKLPDDFQTAEYLLEHGFVDAIVPRLNLRQWLIDALSFHRPECKVRDEAHGIALRPGKTERTPWETVQLARNQARPTIRDYVSLAFDSFTELHGDRKCGDDKALVGGLASIGGAKVMLIGHQKGQSAEENLKCNFGMANPEGYRKALRLMKLAESWGLPVLTLVDTSGAYPGVDAEARGQAEAIGTNLSAMARLRTPIITVITGEGGSGGAIGIAAGNRIYMMENAVYSVISPEGCAAILWKDGALAPKAAEALKITAGSLLELGVVDAVIPEPEGGAHLDKAMAAKALKSAVLEALRELFPLSGEELVKDRYRKFTGMGR